MSGRYRRGALAALVGVCCLTVALELPAFRPPTGGWRTDVLAIGGVALVAGVLDVVFTTGDATPRSVPAAMQAARSADVEARVGEGTNATRRYVPTANDVRLHVADVPLHPVGAHLLASLDRDPLDGATAPETVTARLADIATGRFELAADVRPVETDGAAAVVVTDAVGDPIAVDAPIASLLAVGLARAHDDAVIVTTADEDEGVRLTYRYE